MTLVCRSVVALAFENMAQMAAAVGANNFSACHAKSTILVTSHSSGNAVKISRPAATRLEFVIGLVERCAASCTGIDAFRRVVLVELARARWLSALLSQDAKLFCDSALADAPSLERGVEDLPLLSTARHSSFERLSG